MTTRKRGSLLPASRKKESPVRYIYGPVPSRRLGFSLGVDILPYKTCSLDCIYCQLGSTGKTTVRRRAFFPVREVLGQVREALASGARIDHITFSGSGEPTLNRSLGTLIKSIKRMTSVPVAVLTNGTLLHRKDVRRDLAAADLVVPSLDAADRVLFRRVNRPHRSLKFGPFIEGLMTFRREFKGRIWLEVMLVKGINDGPEHVARLREIVAAVRPDRLHLNTVVRPPAEKRAKPLTARELEKVRRALGGRAEAAAEFKGKGRRRRASDLEGKILAMVCRRPVTPEDIAASLGLHPNEVNKILAALLAAEKVRRADHAGRSFYEPGRG